MGTGEGAASRWLKGSVCLWFGLAALLAVVLWAAQPASARTVRPKTGPVSIVSPAADSLARGRFIRLAVRVLPGTRIVGSHIDDRSVSLKRRGRLWVAKLRRNRLEPGPELLVVQGRTPSGAAFRDTARFFIAGHRRRGLVRLKVGGANAAGPLRVKARVSDQRIRLRARLNDRGVGPFFGRLGRTRSASLSASDGLHYGHNFIRVVAFLPDGSYSAVTRSFRRDRVAPLVGAGKDRSAAVGRAVKLNGRASRSVVQGGELSYRWRIARRPAGSKARLRRAGSATPALKPDRNGTYRVRLTVGENDSLASKASANGASDVLTVTVLPDSAPIGVPIDTWDTSSGAPALDLGGQPIQLPTSGYMLVVLDRAGPQGGTLEVTTQSAIPFGQESTLATAVSAQTPSSLVIIVGTPDGPTTENSDLDTAFKAIGGQTPIGDLSAGFSIVGIPGQSQGEAYQYVQPPSDFPDFAGINGYLTQDSTGPFGSAGFVFAPGQFLPFSLGPGGASQMTIGCTPQVSVCTQISPPSVPPTQGFEMAVVDPYSLQQIGSAQGFDDTPAGLQALSAQLQAVSADDLVLLKSVGSPAPMTADWFDLSRAIYAVGGNPQIFNDLNPPNGPGTNDYGFVGGPAVTGTEVWGQSENGEPFGMSGVLTRSNSWRFAGAHADAFNGERTYPLEQIAYEPPYQEQGNPSYTFPLQGNVNDPNDPYGQAEHDLAAYYYCPPDPNRTVPCVPEPDIRSQYSLTNHDSTQWTPSLLKGMPLPANAPYSQTQLNDLVQQITVEMEDVNAIQLLEQGLLTPSLMGGTDTTPTLQTISNDISNDVNVSGSRTVIADLLGSLEGVLFLASSELGPVEGEAEGGAALGALGSAFDALEPFVTDQGGNPILAEITVREDQLASELWTNFTDAQVGYDRLTEILVSDWNKMQWAYDLYQTGLSKLENSDALAFAINALQMTGRRTAWRGLMNLAFDSDQTPAAPLPGTLSCIAGFEPDGTGIKPNFAYLTLEPSNGTEKIAAQIFATPTYASGDLNAAEDPDDFWVREWPDTASGPCK